MGRNPSFFQGGNVPAGVHTDSLPVEQVSWYDIKDFEARTGLGLPTEAQWEYACRGGTKTAFSFGSGESCADWSCGACNERDSFMWYCANGQNRTHEVGTKAPNAFGLHDMHANVWELCEDLYSSVFYGMAEATDPDPLSSSGSQYPVVRGGSWRRSAAICRSADRWSRPVGPYNDTGFRPAVWPLP